MTVSNDADLIEDGFALSQVELDYLSGILSHGDRAAFYATYNAMGTGLDRTEVGSTEAALQAKISTFSDDVGAVAFYANALLQGAFGSSGYPGIYYLSQQVASSALTYMKSEEANGGVLDSELFFRSAEGAWDEYHEVTQFPGNLLTSLETYQLPRVIGHLLSWLRDAAVPAALEGRPISQQEIDDFIKAGDGQYAGERASLLAMIFVATSISSQFGKTVEDYDGRSGFEIVTSPDSALRYAVDTSTGKTVAVEDAGAGGAQDLLELTLEVLAEVAPVALGLPVAYLLPTLHEQLQPVFDSMSPPNGDWTLLSESTQPGVYDGDANTPSQENDFSNGSGGGAMSAAASSESDILFGTSGVDIIDGGDGDDIVFGGDGNDALSGSSGSDILWGQEGEDVLVGGAGGDVLRGGDDGDILFGGVAGATDYFSNIDDDDDVLIGGGGNDVMIVRGGDDILIGNTGNDKFYFGEAAGDGMKLIWGGDGDDEYHFGSLGSRVLLLHAPEISTDILLNLDLNALKDSIASEFGAVDYVILNPEQDDKIFTGNYEVTSYSINLEDGSYGDSFAIGDEEFTGNYHNDIPIFDVPYWYEYETQSQNAYHVGGDINQRVQTSTSEGENGPFSLAENSYNNIWLSDYRIDDGELPRALSISGFIQGDLGISINGNAPVVQSTTQSWKWLIDDTNYDYLHLVEHEGLTFYLGMFEDQPNLGQLVDFEETSSTGDDIVAAEFSTASRFMVDLSAFQLNQESVGPIPPTPTPPVPTAGGDYLQGHDGHDNIDAGDGDDIVLGKDGNDAIDGGAGNDVLLGQSDNDTLSGGAGDDQLIGGVGADQLYGGDGDDTLVIDIDDTDWSGDAGYDTLRFEGDQDFTYALAAGSIEAVYSGGGNDALYGEDGVDNFIDGGAGDDFIQAFAGDDHVVGGAGADELLGGDGDDTVVIDADDVYWEGADGYDTLIYDGNEDFSYALAQGEFEAVQSGGGNDSLYGTTGSNDMDGGAGDDIIFGYEGDDRLVGGAGDDFLVGGTGADTFVFADGGGVDWIDDFDVAEDKIDLSSASGISDFNDVLALANDYGSGTTWIAFDNDNEIRLEGVALASLSASNFIFAA